MTWEEAWQIGQKFSDHYAMAEESVRAIYDVAVTLPAGSTMLELGVCNGRTTAVMAYVAKHKGLASYGIDDDSLEGTIGAVGSKLAEFGLPATLIMSKTNDYPWDKPIDLLVIDAGHDEKNITQDIGKYVPFVKPGGYVVFDDWDTWDGSPHWAVVKYGTEAMKAWTLTGQFARARIYQNT